MAMTDKFLRTKTTRAEASAIGRAGEQIADLAYGNQFDGLDELTLIDLELHIDTINRLIYEKPKKRKVRRKK